MEKGAIQKTLNIKQLEQAARSGSSDAALTLFVEYGINRPVSYRIEDLQNVYRAMYYLKQMAEQYSFPSLGYYGLALPDEVKTLVLNEDTEFGIIRRAAEAGNAKALFCLGQLYDKGIGVECDQDKAIEYYTQTIACADASLGCMVGEAQVALAEMAFQNYHYFENEEEWYLRWILLAVKQNNRHALCSLGYQYATGYRLGRDEDKGHVMLLQAAIFGSAEAWLYFGKRAFEYDNFGIADGYFKQAVKLLPARAYGLFRVLHVNDLENGSFKKGFAYLEKGYALGSRKAAYRLAQYYEEKWNKAERLKYLTVAAMRGHWEAQQEIRSIFKYDEEVKTFITP